LLLAMLDTKLNYLLHGRGGTKFPLVVIMQGWLAR